MAAAAATLTLAGIFVLLVIRIVYILGANSIGELIHDLLYLRADAFRMPLLLLVVVLGVEVLEFIYPFLMESRLLPAALDLTLYVNLVQVLLLVAAAVLVVRTLRTYTERGLSNRLRENVEALALLAGQRRLRRGERAERPVEAPAEE